MENIATKIGIDQACLARMLDFFPYPFLISEYHSNTQHNIFVNNKFAEEIGYTCQEIPTLEDWFLKAYPDQAYRNAIIQDWNERVQQAKNERRDSVVKQARIQTKQFGLKWYEVKASVFGPFNFVAFINIDDEVINEERLKLLNENKDRTLSILSHDLRTPLTNLYSVLHLLRSGHLTPNETGNVLQKIGDQVFKMLEFLDTTLQWSTINFNELHPASEQIDIHKITRTIINLYQAALKEKEIEVVSTIENHIPFFTDSEIFSILLRNLLSNAIKYTPPRGKIMVHSEVTEKYLLLSMTNTGEPISEEKINTILPERTPLSEVPMARRDLVWAYGSACNFSVRSVANCRLPGKLIKGRLLPSGYALVQTIFRSAALLPLAFLSLLE